uniref:NADH-ubiquinone oxidoreductase chain 4 n=1 Tax=Spongiocaris panglao TaxID=1986577 RepID=A0A345F0M7_9EUCA|nr:NADH dehydrogenase subunit 4 [Spongiocaris panglao]AXG21502.1 NADH dehydrogenase subunit 4 [Spongiocaris panglao]
MLKYVLSLLLLMSLSVSWLSCKLFLFLLFFLISVSFNYNFFVSMSSFYFNMDSLSYALIILSIWIIILIIQASEKIYKENNHFSLFMTMLIMLLVFLILTFSVMDYLLFYISFESSLIPTLILILGWGYQPERLQAGVYMLFYTLFASLPLLISIISLYKMNGSLVMGFMNMDSENSVIYFIWYLASIFAFMVKLPMFLVHLWLPKAHVEAPVAGSMILAGVLLKLGGYGLIRMLYLFSYINMYISWIWLSISLVGGVIVSFSCLRQVDMKALIAYSSVVHMGLVLCGLMSFNWWGLNGALVVMMGHGLCSSGLFCLANMTYERMGSRSMMISKGMLNIMPNMALWWFLLSVGNMAAPPTLNLLGEICLFISILSWNKLSMLGLSILSFFSACYTLYLYSMSQHGKFYSSLFSCCSGKVAEYYTLSLHWIPLNLVILSAHYVFYLI